MTYPGRSMRAAAFVAALVFVGVGSGPAPASQALPAASPAQAFTSDWPQYQADAGHTGWERGEAILNPANVHRLEVLWIAPVTGPGLDSGPIESSGKFFAGSADGYGVQAIDATTGHVVWTRTISSVSALPAPAVVGGAVLQPTADHGLVALDPESGSTVWESPVDGELSGAPTVAAGHVFVPGLDFAHGDHEGLFAFDVTTGKGTNTRDVPGRFGLSVAGAAGRRVVWSLSSGRPGDSRVIAFADADRRKIWTQREGLGTNVSTPVIANGAVYVVSDGDVFDLDLLTGAVVWRTTNGAYFSLAAAGSSLFATSRYTATVTELDGSTGAAGWVAGTGGLDILSPPVVGGGVVFVPSDDRVYAFDESNGTLLWISRSVGANYPSLALVDGRLYAQTAGRLWAFHLPKH